MFGASKPGFTFGSTQPSGSSLFGSTAATTTASGFGGFGAKPFGATATPTFGAATPSGGLFGATSTQPSGGLFGATTTPQQATSGGLFGSSTSSSFLKPATTTQGFSGFGTTSTGGGLFGATTQPTQATGGLFGSTTSTAATGSNLFGASTSGFGAASQPTGTAAVKFSPVDGTDNMVRSGVTTQVKTKHYCITGMKQYEAKSLEELRLDDYAAGLRGPKAGGAATGTGLFGSTVSQPAASSTGFGGFGAAATSANTGFGGFGTTTTQATGFGAKPTGGLFGGASTSTGGLFGQTSTAAPAFGSTTPAAGGLFGSTVTTKPNPFGASTGFGTGTAFGQASTASTGFGGFGTKTAAPAFGAATSANTGFGGFGTQTTTAGFGGFGAKPALTFGAQPAASGAGVFGAAATGFAAKQTTGFGFGTGTLTGMGTTTAQAQQPVLLTSNTNAQAQQELIQQHLLNLANSPYGDSPLFRNIKKERKSRSDIIPTDPAAQKSVLTSSGGKLKVSSRPASKVKLTNLPSVQAIGTSSKSNLFDGLEDDTCTPEKYGTRRSVKKLVIRSSPAVGGSSTRMTTADQQHSAFSSPSVYSGLPRPDAVHSTLEAEESFNLSGTKVERRPVNRLYPSLELDDTMNELQAGSSRPKLSPVDRKPVINTTYVSSTPPGDGQQEETIPSSDSPQSKPRLNVSKLESVDIQAEEDADEQSSPSPHPCGVICTRTDYYTLPSLEKLGDYLDANGDCFVENLTIGREGYGSVFFPGTTNVANLDIDSTVHFRRKEITIYPDDDNKPPQGQGLNKKAEVTLDFVWPKDKSCHSPIKSPERLKAMNYQDKIEMATLRIGARFIDYRPDTGSWVFEVKHFSKYGLLDDDSDEDNTTTQATSKEGSKLKTLNIQTLNVQKQQINRQPQLSGDTSGKPAADVKQGLLPSATNYLGDSEEERENRKPEEQLEFTQMHARNVVEQEDADMSLTRPLSMSHQLAAQCGVGSTNIQRMKASFLDEDEDDLNMSLLGRGDKGSPAGLSMRKQWQMADSFSMQPQSPLIRSGLKAASPSLHKLHGSFFGTEAKPDMSMDYEKEEKPLRLLNTNRRSTDIQLPEVDYPLLPSGAEKSLQPRSRIQGHRLQLKQIPFSLSLLHGRQRNSALDAACAAGRRSRVGWTKNQVVVHIGSSINNEEKHTSRSSSTFSILSPRRSAFVSPYQVTVETASFGPQSNQLDPLVLETRLKALRIQLKHLTHTGTAAYPKLEPAPGIAALHEYGRESLNDLDTALANQSGSAVESMFRHNVLVWELAVALWGSLPEFEQMDDIDKDSYLYQSARNEAFSRWLSYAASHQVELLTKQPPKQVGDAPSSIFAHLTARQVPEATKLAVECKDLRLALLISQAGSSQTTKNMIHKQLVDWIQTGADKYISPDRLKLYTLLAGCMVWEGSTGLVNCCMDLDWKRALALHFWYSQSKLSIPSALARYDAAWQESSACETYAAPPIPPYLEESGGDDIQSRDTCYHLLKLYCNSSYRLDQLLLTASSTSDPMDYHMSWHLMQVISALGYTHLDDWQATCLHTRYSEQLESCGLWEWAIVPLLHLPSRYQREKCVKDLLLRHVRLDVADGSDSDSVAMSEDEDSERSEYAKKEKFVMTELNIPAKWMSETKAIKARFEGLFEEEAWHLLQCQQYNSAHKLVLDKLAPQYIVRGDLDGLHSYLDQLHRGADSVSGWKVGGKVYLDYITTHDVINDIRQQPGDSADGYSLEKLRPEVLSLARRLLAMASPTPLHLLAKSTMALDIAHDMKYLRSLEEALVPDSIGNSTRYLVEPLSILPLQSDDALVLLKETLSSFMSEY